VDERRQTNDSNSRTAVKWEGKLVELVKHVILCGARDWRELCANMLRIQWQE